MKPVALLLIDFQKDCFPGGKIPQAGAFSAARKAYALLQCFRERGGRHVHVQHIATEPDAPFFARGDEGSDIHDSVAHFEGEPIVYKRFANAFRETDLLDRLKEWGIKKVIITGMMTHWGVDSTARAAADLGFQVVVVEDACATSDLQYGETLVPAEFVQKAFLAALQSCGEVTKTETLMARLAA